MLPLLVQHLSPRAVGYLRATCRLLRTLPCVLGTPTAAQEDCPLAAPSPLLSAAGTQLLLTLPRLESVCLGSPTSLYGLQRMVHLHKVIICEVESLDLSPLTDVAALRSLDVSLSYEGCLAGLGGITQLTSLAIRGGVHSCHNKDQISQLISLRSLELWQPSVIGLTITHLTALTSLTGPDTLCEHEVPGLPLLCLQLTKLDKCSEIEDTLLRLTSLQSLTLIHCPPASGFPLDNLQQLPRLRELALHHCYPSAILQLPALTDFTYVTRIRQMPSLSGCLHLQRVCLFVEKCLYVLSLAWLPPLSSDRPLHIKYVLRHHGSVSYDPSLFVQRQMRDGLYVDQSTQLWPCSA